MKLVIYSINYYPELVGVGKYSTEMAEWLVNRGHEVHVVTAYPYYPQWALSGPVFKGYKDETVNGVSVSRCPLYVPSKPTGIKRIIHLLSFAISSFPKIIKQYFWKPDVILVIEPPLFLAPSTLVVSKLAGAKSFLHIQDFEVDAAFELGLLNNNILRKIVSLIEQFIMNKFDCVSTISSKMQEKLSSKNVSPSKQYMFVNWVDTNLITPLTKQSEYYAELNVPLNKKVLLYSGNMGNKQGLEIIIKAARRLTYNESVVFVMCGEGSSISSLKDMASDLTNIIWLPFQPLNKLNQLLGFATIHLLPQSKAAADLVMPSKLTGMLSSGRPIITTAVSKTQLGQVVAKCGIVVEPEDDVAFSAAIETLIENPILCKKHGLSARKIAEEQLGTDMVLTEFENKLNALIN